MEPKPPVPSFKIKPKKNDKASEKNFRKQNIIHMIKSTPKKPTPALVDTPYGNKQKLIPSGLLPNFIFKEVIIYFYYINNVHYYLHFLMSDKLNRMLPSTINFVRLKTLCHYGAPHRINHQEAVICHLRIGYLSSLKLMHPFVFAATAN